MANNIIKGRKGGGSKQRTPTEQPDDLQSVAKAKILLALGEGEFAGGLTGKDIYLDGTPLENADGSQNFSGVSWEFRPGTQAQTYIQGIPGIENEISVGTEDSSKTATWWAIPSSMRLTCRPTVAPGRRCWKPLSRVKPPPVMSGAIVLICPRPAVPGRYACVKSLRMQTVSKLAT